MSVGLAGQQCLGPQGKKTIIINTNGSQFCVQPFPEHFLCMISFPPPAPHSPYDVAALIPHTVMTY